MKRIAESTPRPYRSSLREDQTRATRTRILDATLRVMARGLAEVSVPAVAREAKVSVPTVYRHFPTKSELMSALYPHLAERAGLQRVEDVPLPRSLAEFRGLVRAMFGRIEAVGLDELAVAALSGPAAEEARRVTMPGRLAAIGQVLETAIPDVADPERARVARLLAVLASSSALRSWWHLGSSTDEAADDIDWMVRSVVAAARSKPQPGRE